MRNKRFFTIVCIIGSLFLIQLQPILAATNVGLFYSELTDTPVIDGTFETSVWDGNLAKDITLYDVTNQSNFLVVALMAVFNTTSDNLTLGFYIEDATSGADILGIVFESNPAYELYIDTPNWGFGAGHDLKVHYLAPNYGLDGFTGLAIFDGTADTDTGGANHLTSKSKHTGSFYHVEMTAPLDSVELDTLDYSLAVNDNINFTLIYVDDDTSITYTQYKEADNDWDYCELIVSPNPTGGCGFSIYLIPMILLVFIPIIFVRAKNFNYKEM